MLLAVCARVFLHNINIALVGYSWAGGCDFGGREEAVAINPGQPLYNQVTLYIWLLVSGQ